MTGRLRTVARAVAIPVARTVARSARRVPPPLVVMAVTLVSLYLAYRHAYPCANLDPGPDVLWRNACYNDIQPLYSGRGLNEGLVPYLDHEVEYPVLIGAFMAVVGLPIHAMGESGRLEDLLGHLGVDTVDEGLVFFWTTAAVLAVLALVTTWALLRCRRDRPWDVLLWAASPSLVLAGPINWDLLAVSLTTLALAAWARGHPGRAGVLLGLGAAAKLYPLLVLGPLVILCLRRRTPHARRTAVRLSAAAAAAWLAVNLPVMVVNVDGWRYAYTFSQERWIDWGSLWFLVDQLGSGLGAQDLVHPLLGTVPALNLSSLVLFGVTCAGIAALIWFAPRRPRAEAMAFLVVAAFLLTNKVWSPQFVLWLLPLAVLARPRWGWYLLWQAAEATYLFSVMRAVLGERDGYALIQASGMRWLAVAVLAGLVVAEALHPERDVVRGTGPRGETAGEEVPAGTAPPAGTGPPAGTAPTTGQGTGRSDVPPAGAGVDFIPAPEAVNSSGAKPRVAGVGDT